MYAMQVQGPLSVFKMCSLGYENIRNSFLATYFILQDGSGDPNPLGGGGDSSGIHPLPGLETILEELLHEDGSVSNFRSCLLLFFPPLEDLTENCASLVL